MQQQRDKGNNFLRINRLLIISFDLGKRNFVIALVGYPGEQEAFMDINSYQVIK